MQQLYFHPLISSLPPGLILAIFFVEILSFKLKKDLSAVSAFLALGLCVVLSASFITGSLTSVAVLKANPNLENHLTQHFRSARVTLIITFLQLFIFILRLSKIQVHLGVSQVLKNRIRLIGLVVLVLVLVSAFLTGQLGASLVFDHQAGVKPVGI